MVTATLTDESGARTPVEPRLAGYTGHLVRLAFPRAESCGQAALPDGRSPRDLAVLTVLAEQPLSQARLGTLLGVNRTVMVSVIDGLEGAGLVRRDRDPADRRRYALCLTDAGRTALDQMNASLRGAEATLTAPLSREGHRRLNQLLRPIIPELVEALPAAVTDRVGFLLDHVSRRLRALREEALRAQGIEPWCVGMLVALDSVQPCTQERLAGCMGVSSPTIVQSIDDLHTAGLISRDRNPADRREHVLRLTAKGQEYLAEALKAEDNAQRALAERLGQAETAELNELLTTLVGA